jgi:hypothetical protein
MNRLKSSVFLFVALTGCTSLNVVTLAPGTIYVPAAKSSLIKPTPEVAEWKQIPEAAEASVAVKVPEEGVYVCPEYVFHKNAPAPQLPLKEMYALSKTDKDAMISLLIKHTDDLRKHISTLNAQDISDKQRYLLHCKKYHDSLK